MRPILKLGFAVGLAAVSGAVSATECHDALDQYSNAVAPLSGSQNIPFAELLLSNHPECFGGGRTTSVVQINGTAFQQVTAISQALGQRWSADAPGPRAAIDVKGMAASTKGKAWNVWGSVGNNDTSQRYTSIIGNTVRNDTDVLNTVLGVDYSLSPTMVFGVSAAFDRGSGSGSNSGSTDLNSVSSDGYLVAPYLGIQINKDLIFDVSAGIGSGKIKSNTGTEAKADRWFAGANLGYERWMGNWQLAGKASLLHGEEDYENGRTVDGIAPGTAAKNTIDQLRLTFQAGYWINGFMPYASIGYVSDLDRKTTQIAAPSDPIGKNAWVWSVGANFFSLSSGVSGGIAYRQEESRDNQKNNSLTANVNFRF